MVLILKERGREMKMEEIERGEGWLESGGRLKERRESRKKASEGERERKRERKKEKERERERVRVLHSTLTEHTEATLTRARVAH